MKNFLLTLFLLLGGFCSIYSFSSDKSIQNCQKIVKVEWRNERGIKIEKGFVEKPIKLHAKTENIKDDEFLIFNIYDENERQVDSISARIENSEVEAEWTYLYGGQEYTKMPTFYFIAKTSQCEQVKSKKIKIAQKYEIMVLDEYTFIQKDVEAKLSNGKETIEKRSPNGIFEFEVVPGNWKFIITDIMDTWEYGIYEDIDKYTENVIKVGINKILNEGINCDSSLVIILVEFLKGISVIE